MGSEIQKSESLDGNPLLSDDVCPQCGGYGEQSQRHPNGGTYFCVRCGGQGTFSAGLARLLSGRIRIAPNGVAVPPRYIDNGIWRWFDGTSRNQYDR